MKNKHDFADIVAIIIYIIQIIIKLVFYVSIMIYFFDKEPSLFKIFILVSACLCIIITVDDLIYTVLSGFYFGNYTTFVLDEPTNIFDYKLHIKNTEVTGYAKGYFIKYDKETKLRKLLVYMYNDKLYPLDDVEIMEDKSDGNSIAS